MSYNNSDLTKAFHASAAINPYSIVKFGASDDTVSPAAAAGDLSIGVTNELGITAGGVTKGETVDVVLAQIAEVKLGGTIVRGDKITSGAAGVGVKAAPAAGTNAQIIGFAMKSGVSGDVIPVYLSQSVMQG